MHPLTRYKKLRNLLHDKIVSGKYAVGDRFPSQNELIKRYNLSFSTVSRALDELVRDGFLMRETGRGTFVKSLNPAHAVSSTETKNMFIFVPMTGVCGGLVDATRLYQHLDAKRSDNVSIRIIPHTTGPEDLDYFLFSREEIHLAVFLNTVEVQLPFREMLSNQCPVLTIAATDLRKNIGNLHIDYASPTADAAAYLIAQGHKQIALFCGSKMLPDTVDCIAAYKSALDAASLPFRDSLVKYTPTDTPSSPQLLSGWNDFESEITALLILVPEYTEEIISAINSSGRRIPEDISLISLDTASHSSSAPQAVSCIEISAGAIAEKLLDILSRITRRDVIHETVKARLVIRQSTGPHLTTSSSLK